MSIPFFSKSELSRILAMVRKYDDLVNMVGDPKVLREVIDRAEKMQAQIASTYFPLSRIDLPANLPNLQDILQQAPRPIPNWDDPKSLIKLLEVANLNMERHYYEQALSCLKCGHYEACNAMLRSFLEALLMTIYERVTNKNAKNDTSAVDKLHNIGLIIYPEDSESLHKTINDFNTNGSHPGLSNKEEATERIHNATLLGHFLIKDYCDYRKQTRHSKDTSK